MKRIAALLILLFMFNSFVVPILYIDNKEIETDVIKISSLSNNSTEIMVDDVKEENSEELAIQEMQYKLLGIESIENNMEWYIAYKNIISEYESFIDPPETIYDYYTEYEINLICRVVETETYQCDFDSKVNVVNVIFNRLNHGDFGNTLEEIIKSENQFSYDRNIISKDTILAVEYAFMMEDTTYGALYFHSNNMTNTFCGRPFIFQDSAGHNFY